MSLLNKMLADLETRALEAPQQGSAAPVLAGLHAANEEPRRSRLRGTLWTALLAAVALSVALRFYPQFYERWNRYASAPAIQSITQATSHGGTASTAATSNEATVPSPDQEVANARAPQAVADEPASSAAASEVVESQSEDATTVALALEDQERAMAAADFVAVPLPAVLGSIAAPEEPPMLDPLEPQPEPERASAPVLELANPPTEVSVVQASEPSGSVRTPRASKPGPKNVASTVVEAIPDAPNGTASAELETTDEDTLPRAVGLDEKRQPKSSAESSLVMAAQPLNPAEQAQQAYLDALLLVEEGRLTEAEANFRRSLRLDPAHHTARAAFAGVLRDQQRIQEAQSLLEDGITVSPNATDLRQWLARVYLEQGLHERAVAVLEEGRSFAQEDGEYLAVLAAFYQQAGQFKSAAEAYRQALARDGQQGRWWMGLGLALESDGQPIVAAQAYERALGAPALPRDLIAFTRARLAAARNHGH